jgi:hypothetical protein
VFFGQKGAGAFCFFPGFAQTEKEVQNFLPERGKIKSASEARFFSVRG